MVIIIGYRNVMLTCYTSYMVLDFSINFLNNRLV